MSFAMGANAANALDSWPGISHVAVGMARQGYDLQLTRYDEKGWRATFYTTGMEHSPTSATGTGWERAPWRSSEQRGRHSPKRRAMASGGSAERAVLDRSWTNRRS